MKQLFFLSVIVTFFSCADQKKESDSAKEKPRLSIVAKHSTLKSVHKDFATEVEDWKELQAVNLFIKKFESVSPSEALTNALELRDLVKSLKDSVMPVPFDSQAFIARVNVLNNEVLRLADLTLIPAITADEVNRQVNKTIAATSALNSKINTILIRRRFEENVEIDLDKVGLDSTRIDSISKKSILLNQQKQESKDNLLRKQH